MSHVWVGRETSTDFRWEITGNDKKHKFVLDPDITYA